MLSPDPSTLSISATGITRTVRTVRYLRPAPPLRARVGPWAEPARRRACMVGPDRFRFLNHEGTMADAAGWNDAAQEKLWLYNLHYFDDLNAEGAEERAGWHRALVDRWVAENPPAAGNGWEPYPLSLRIVNWVKWALAGHALGEAATQSLAVQARQLARRLVVDSGVSIYAGSPQRMQEKGTVAHNTVSIAGYDSSKLWGAFRAGRRARPVGLRITDAGDAWVVECAHDGYLRAPWRTLHRRVWRRGRGVRGGPRG